MGVIIKRVLLYLILSLRVGHESSSTGAQYVALQKKLIDWRKVKTPWFISANFRFGPAFLHKMLWKLVKVTSEPNTCCWLAG